MIYTLIWLKHLMDYLNAVVTYDKCFKVLRQATVAYAEMLLSFLSFLLSIVSPCPCLFFLIKDLH